MVNLKIRVIKGESAGDFEKNLNAFLETIDMRQIIKIDHQYDNNSNYRGFVYYTGIDDLRDLKIDTILFTKN